MTQSYRVRLYLTDFDESRASELKQALKIYHNSQGKDWLKGVLRKVHEGGEVLVYETNSDPDARRVGMSFVSAGAHIKVDGLEDEEAEF